MPTRQLFVVVATGQRVANLPPVLERAEPGDHVLWVESPEARQGGWSVGPRQVLQGHGLVNIEAPVEVEQINDPVQLTRACEPAAEAFQRQGFRPVLVSNGGQKLTPVGLLQAWERLKPVLLYGDDRPAALWTFENGVQQSPTIQPYSRHRLDIDDVLMASGHVRVGSDEGPALRLWPNTHLPDSVRSERYGREPEYTAELHRIHHAWAAARRSAGEPPRFSDVLRLLSPERIAKWRRTLRGGGETVKLGPEQDIYNATLNLMREAATSAARSGLTEPAVRLGPCLERTVARRVVPWLEADAVRARAVQSVWLNVRIASTRTPERSAAQFDVVVVLRNGILLHLECKTAAETAEPSDLDRRLLNLQQAASQLAQMVVCLPLFTTWSDETWFADLHALRQRLQEIGRPAFVPFTLPDQPTRYTLAGTDDKEHECQVFEDALDRLLEPYLLRPSSSKRSGRSA